MEDASDHPIRAAGGATHQLPLTNMTLIELLIFIIALLLGLRCGFYFFRYIGWWSVILGGIVACGFIFLLGLVLTKFFGGKDRKA